MIVKEKIKEEDMIIYEYKCNSCNRKFEMRQNIKDKPLSICPYCEKRGVERIISGGLDILYKCDGFYNTDNKKEG